MEKFKKPLRISEKECSSNSSLPDDNKRINRRDGQTVSSHFLQLFKIQGKVEDGTFLRTPDIERLTSACCLKCLFMFALV